MLLVERLNSLSAYQVFAQFGQDDMIRLELTLPNTLEIKIINLNEGNKQTNIKINLPDEIKLPPTGFQYSITNNEFAQCKIDLKEKKEHKIYKSDNTLPKVNEIQELQCKNCKLCILKSNESLSSLQIKALPSEYWIELSDLWVCHDPQSFQHFPRVPLKAKENHCLVSTTYIMIPETMIEQENIQIKPIEEENRSNSREFDPIYCSKCSSLIGLSNSYHLNKKTNKNNENSLISIKLFKYAIDDSFSNIFSSYNLEYKIAEDILALTQARSCYKILVFGYSSMFYLQVKINFCFSLCFYLFICFSYEF